MWEVFYVSDETNSRRFEETFNGKVAEVIVSGDDLRKLTITISKYNGVNDEGEPHWKTILDIRDTIDLWRSDLFSQVELLISLLCYGVQTQQSYKLCLRIHQKITEKMAKELERNYHDKKD
jgi:hypothetical protein